MDEYPRNLLDLEREFATDVLCGKVGPPLCGGQWFRNKDVQDYASLCEHVLGLAADGVFSGLVTPVTAAELVVKPLRHKRQDLADRYRLALAGLANMRLSELTPQAGWMAGALRAKYELPLPDMLQIAAALQSPKPALITNDKALKKVDELPIFLLSDFR